MLQVLQLSGGVLPGAAGAGVLQVLQVSGRVLPGAAGAGVLQVLQVFQGEGFDPFFQQLRSDFSVLKTRKPDASRSRSRETYLLAKGFRG